MPSPTGPERLRELSRQIKNLAQRCRAAAASAPTEVEGAADGGWRCAPDSLMCMLVYIFSGHCSNTAADFASGRGWRPGASAAAATEEQLAAVERAYIRMPTSVLVDLELEPFKMVGQRDVYCAAKYVLEHRLMAYVEVQNTEHGVCALSCADGRCGSDFHTSYGAAVCERAPWRLGTRYAAEGAEVLGGLSPQMERKVWVPARRRLH